MGAKVIAVVGSINFDLTTFVPGFPAVNQTLLANGALTSIGGKGANQAVAAARAGSQVSMIGRLGGDDFGRTAQSYLLQNDIDVSGVTIDNDMPTGTASIFVDSEAQNMIVVSAGANASLSGEDIERAESTIAQADLLLLQSEVPVEALEAALSVGKQNNVTTMYNPAPIISSSHMIASLVDIVTPNEFEAEQLTQIEIRDIDSVRRAADRLHVMGPKLAVITMGARGCYVSSESISGHFEAPRIDDAVDPTGAGDVFNGVLASALAKREPIESAVHFASAAAALSVRTRTAQDAAPDFAEVMDFLESTVLEAGD